MMEQVRGIVLPSPTVSWKTAELTKSSCVS